MIDRERVIKCFDANEAILALNPKLDVHIDIRNTRSCNLWVFCPTEGLPDDLRQEIIAILTPLVGNMVIDGRDWRGNHDGLSIYFMHAQACKILGYKKVVRTVKRKIERDPEYEEVEQEQRVPITDCDVKAGRFKEDEIEVPA